MYQFNGWFVLRDSAGESDQQRQEEMVVEVENLISGFQWTSGSIELRNVNGEAFVTIVGLSNHRGKEAADLDRFLDFISRPSSGSFGVLHEWDDEAQDWPGPQNFKVRVLTRGVVVVRDDPFFSPIAPTIEDDS